MLSFRFRFRQGRQEKRTQDQHERCRNPHRDQPRHRAAARRNELFRRHGLKLLEQLLPALVAQLQRGRLVGGLRCRAGDGFPHQVNGLLQALVEFGQLGILREFLVQGGGLVVRQFAQQQGGEAGFQCCTRVYWRVRVHWRLAIANSR